MSEPVILHLRGSDIYGSPERLIVGQMQNISSFESVAASFVRPSGSQNPFLDKLSEYGLTHHAVDDTAWFDRRIPGRLRKIFKDRRVDLLVTHEYKSALYGHLAARKLPAKHVRYFHGWTAEDFKVRVYNAIDRMILRRADKVITVSQASAQALVSDGIPSSLIDTVYNAIDLDPEAKAPDRTPNDPPVIGVIGRLSHEKGIHDFLQAMAQIHAQAPRFQALIYGSGPEEERLKQMTTALGLGECVSFEGFRTDIDRVYGQLDFLVLPSLSEGHPVVILEAWKNGVGVVATRAGGTPEVVEHERTGLLTDIGRPDQLGRAILRALKDVPLVNRLGQAGFEEVKAKYSFRQQAQRLEKIYRAVLD